MKEIITTRPARLCFGFASAGQMLGALAILLGGALMPLSVHGEDASAGIDTTRAALEEYVEIQRTISKEKRDLALSKEVLNDRIEVVEQEIKALREKIAEAEGSIDENEAKRMEMIEENDTLIEAAHSLEDILRSLEAGVSMMLTRLPQPIQERVKPLSQRIPEDPDATKLSLSERFQNVVGILNEVDKFNRDISVTSEIRTLPDGSSAEVTTLYLGAGQAYYVSANGKIAGTGRSSEEGWVWEPANDAAPQIAQAIAIMKNEAVASFVQLPIEIQ